MNLGLLKRWRDKGDSGSAAATVAPEQPRAASAVTLPHNSEGLARELIVQGRYALMLDREADGVVEEGTTPPAWAALQRSMALVPDGLITLGAPSGVEEASGGLDFAIVASAPRQTVDVPAFYIDRTPVTNEQYAHFVAAGGYDEMDLWPQEIWPSVLQFVDQTGQAGPRFWSNIRAPRGKERHPVVGVCWYEAVAYARWVGKRLAAAAEWEKAGSWPADLSGHGPKVRYPWGNSFAANRANTWSANREDTVAVDAFPEGGTPNGIYQLSGNVWEWLEDEYGGPLLPAGIRVHVDQPMRQIRGGAFDTYFEVEGTCHFCTGHPVLDRRNNIGFRCALSADRLRPDHRP